MLVRWHNSVLQIRATKSALQVNPAPSHGTGRRRPRPAVLSRVEDIGADVAMIIELSRAHILRCNDHQQNVDGFSVAGGEVVPGLSLQVSGNS
jgi:hypothetical protein